MSVRDWVPSPDDVGAVLRARTKVLDTGVELGTFTSETRPNRNDILPLIDTVVARISARTGKIGDDIQAFARRTAAIGVACEVELSYFPEQIGTGRSPYEQLKVAFDESLLELITSAQDSDGNEDTGDIEALATHSFPYVCNPIGLSSRW